MEKSDKEEKIFLTNCIKSQEKSRYIFEHLLASVESFIHYVKSSIIIIRFCVFLPYSLEYISKEQEKTKLPLLRLETEKKEDRRKYRIIVYLLSFHITLKLKRTKELNSIII